MRRFFGRRKEKETKEENSDEGSDIESDADKRSRGNKRSTNAKKVKKEKPSKRKDPESDVSSDLDEDSETDRPKGKNVSERDDKTNNKQIKSKTKENITETKKKSKHNIIDEETIDKSIKKSTKQPTKSHNERKQLPEKDDKIVTKNKKQYKKVTIDDEKSIGKDAHHKEEIRFNKSSPKSNVKITGDRKKIMKSKNKKSSKSEDDKIEYIESNDESETNHSKTKSKEDKRENLQKSNKKKYNESSNPNKDIEETESDESIEEGEEDSDVEESVETEEGESAGEEEKEEGSDLETHQKSLVKAASKKKIPLESQAKFYQDRAVGVEKHYGQFCQLFGSITRKMARTRDKGDLLSKQLLEYAKQEKISHSTSKNLKEFAHNLAAVQDYRDAEIRRLESKVVKPMSAYGSKCKTIKQLVKREQGAINREIKQRKNLDKVRDKKPGDAHSIAETEVKKAAESAQIGIQGLQNQMCTFEKEKLSDLKNILADFVSIELVFHAKAIEFYSKCFDNLAMIDEEMDLEEFKRKISLEQGAMQFGPQAPVPQGTITSVASEQMMSTLESTGSEYTSTGASYTYTYGDSTMSTSGEKRVRIQTQSMYADDDDDDDNDDDDDDDYEEDEVQNYSRPIRR